MSKSKAHRIEPADLNDEQLLKAQMTLQGRIILAEEELHKLRNDALILQAEVAQRFAGMIQAMHSVKNGGQR